MNLTKTQINVLVGSILGDAFLQSTGKNNARLRFEHSQDQKEYLRWKVNFFGRLFQGKETYLERVHPKTNKTYKYVRHQTTSTPSLGFYHKLFYSNNGKKKVPENIKEFLDNPLALCVWYLDDGYYYAKDKNSLIYLGKVTKREATLLSDALVSNFQLNNKIYDKKNKGFALFFGVNETKILHSIISKFIISEMKYKIEE